MHARGEALTPASAGAGHASRVLTDATASGEFTPKQVGPRPRGSVLIKRGAFDSDTHTENAT